jgi:hypothetical protein
MILKYYAIAIYTSNAVPQQGRRILTDHIIECEISFAKAENRPRPNEKGQQYPKIRNTRYSAKDRRTRVCIETKGLYTDDAIMYCGLSHDGAGLVIRYRGGLLYTTEQEYSHEKMAGYHIGLASGLKGLYTPMYDYML